MPTAPVGGAAVMAMTWLDRAVVAYVMLPVALFIAGWVTPWLRIPVLAVMIIPLRFLAKRPVAVIESPGLGSKLVWALVVAAIWTWLGGTGHFVYANADWHVRDAVLHDLVFSPWPAGYGTVGGVDTMLRTTVAYFLPAALIGKLAGLAAAHLFLFVWTGLGVWLFLAQVLTLVPSTRRAPLISVLVVILFSGMDVVGSVLGGGARFLHYWSVASHLEWWALSYQYSSFSTQLFWVPNHALAGWLATGFLLRQERNPAFDSLLPLLAVGLMLWSPLTGIGMAPFFAWKVWSSFRADGSLAFLRPGSILPAAVLGVPLLAYLVLDSSAVSRGAAEHLTLFGFVRIMQFYVLEAAILGWICWAILPSGQVVLALLVLAALPFFHIGPSNDLVMRASIPALCVILIQCCRALAERAESSRKRNLQWALAGVLAIGAVTPIEEIARAIILPRWPASLEATLIDASCGIYPPHYVARVRTDAWIDRLFGQPHELKSHPDRLELCVNPASEEMDKAGLL